MEEEQSGGDQCVVMELTDVAEIEAEEELGLLEVPLADRLKWGLQGKARVFG